jgi:hypothetical protein
MKKEIHLAILAHNALVQRQRLGEDRRSLQLLHLGWRKVQWKVKRDGQSLDVWSPKRSATLG